VSDRGPQLTLKFWAAFCHHLSIERRLSIAYHPQTNGQMERQNQTLKQYLREYVNHLQDDWVHWLPLAKFAYNNSVDALTGLTPFYAKNAHHPKLLEFIREVPAERSVPNFPNARAREQRVLEVRAVLEKRSKEATATQRKYVNRRTEP
jgi:transposase InsO family protein